MSYTERTHCELLPHGLFPLLGDRFVRRWHATFLTAPQGIALVAERTDGHARSPGGLLVGAADQVGLVEDVVRYHRLRLGAVGAWSLLARPALLLHFLRTRAPTHWRRLVRRPPASTGPGAPPPPGAASRTGTRTASATASATESATASGTASETAERVRRTPHMAVITAVVVDPAERGMGVGEALVVAFVERARASGAPEAQLTTLSGRDGAGAFYEALGWERVGEHTTRDGARRSTYRLALAEAGRPLVASPLAGPDQERRATRAERNDSR